MYESFLHENTIKTGVVPLPIPNKESLLGGYSVVCVGYNDLLQCFLMRGSQSDIEFPLKHYFWLPYVYILDSHLSSDLYVILNFMK
jgi:C1A family cysteine protease